MVVKLAFIGDGSISHAIRAVLADNAHLQTVALLAQDAPDTSIHVSDLKGLIAREPDLVIECAGHGALMAYGANILRAGIPLVIASVGALADPTVLEALTEASRLGGAMLLPSGAVAGLDGLRAARLDGLDRVTYVSRKPPLAWLGTPAEHAHDLQTLSEATVIFEGTARDAALTYPKNANVAATIALAGLGFERTSVKIIADPAASRNTHELSYSGAFGTCDVTIANEPSIDNPKTSRLTAFSIAAHILDWAQSATSTQRLREHVA